MAFGAAPGDRLSYYLDVSDAFSNTIRVPSGAAQNEIVFRIQEQINPIESVWASGGWAKSSLGKWEVTGEKPGALSSLNSNSISIPQNAIDAVMRLTHAYQFGLNMAVKSRFQRMEVAIGP
jgi:hypothetical protein